MMKETTVFLIDDDDAMRKSIDYLIRSIGLRCQSYATAQDFLDGADPETPGCILTDVRMPGLSGLDLLEEIRGRAFLSPVIIITGHADVPMAVRAFKSGALDFIEKPFNDQMLLDKVQEAIELDASRRTVLSKRATVMDRLGTLTTRETEVLERVIAGKANKEVAADLGLSEKTIEVHRSRVMKKMQALNAADLIRMVLEARQTPETIA
ncbi:MAG: DNA-binding response regulator [Phycisphaeraceae bacterium]|nr:MAG: DNA-binding response regulator [Phycisphaeraceae bacterium]